ncbi:SPOR domain-containing protein [Ruegeria sp. 2205SS24-7]|uniref:SPOR domain-containing protein n=1 Tax=Ruegeria discodermiae TaxID=3064389 RepID=UPI002740AF5B|nr:SPOR domain-containing protein [Ruegeria sp. 2205SS24-7]MDP5216031.1 SPOR domain-containing protein [Ruegeria sp. 2205SS24-7]
MASYDGGGQYDPRGPRYDQYGQEVHYDDYPEADMDVARPSLGGRLSRMASMLGAVGSLALVVGIGVWGVKLVVRDVSGVPVVRALEGPMRIQPENPGGERADHQGLAVNNVAARGTAAPPPDRLVLAPRPVDLAEEDGPMGEINPSQEEVESAKPVTDGAVAAFKQGSVDALVAELTKDVQPMVQNAVLTGDAPDEQLAAITQTDPLPAIDPADLVAQLPDPDLLEAPGVKRSPRPIIRPARAVPSGNVVKASLNDAINAAVESAAGLEVDPAEIPAGTRLAQLGAFESPEIARSEWDRLSGQFSDYMSDKQRVVQKATSNGRTFYRLRAMGFSDMSDARRFCATLGAERVDCIPVTVR